MKVQSVFRTLLIILSLGSAAQLSRNPSYAGESVNTAGPVQQGTSTGIPGDYANNVPAVTISLAGQTALRNFTGSPGITTLAHWNVGHVLFRSGGNAGHLLRPQQSRCLCSIGQEGFHEARCGAWCDECC